MFEPANEITSKTLACEQKVSTRTAQRRLRSAREMLARAGRASPLAVLQPRRSRHVLTPADLDQLQQLAG